MLGFPLIDRLHLSGYARLPVLLIAGVLIMAPRIFAATVVPTPIGSGSWYAGVTPDQNPSDAFWDNKSRDGSKCGVGYWLGGGETWGTLLGRCQNDGNITSSGGLTTTSKGPGELDFYASSMSAGKPVGWEFMATGTELQSVQLVVELAGWRSANILGYYIVGPDGTRQFDESNIIFSGSANPGASKSIKLSEGQEFGFFLCPKAIDFSSCLTGPVMFSGDQYSDPNSTPLAGKFALFSEMPRHPTAGSDIVKYWVGIEDWAGFDSVERHGDFNDILFSASVRKVNVPETEFYRQLSADFMGILGISWLLRRRSTRKT